MKEYPMLFSTPMVQANLKERKSMTRRIVKPNPRISHDINAVDLKTLLSGSTAEYFCPYGKVGDILWVRETFFDTIDNRNAPLFKDAPRYLYRADGACIGEHKWMPSIYMPREACRILLEITNIRVERLRDITDDDAICEGIQCIETGKKFGYLCDWADKKTQVPIRGTAREAFKSLWISINGKDSWDINPWVWVIEFKRV